MTVTLPPQIERIVNDAVLSGQYSSAEDMLAEAVTVWQSQQPVAPQSAEEHRRAAIERLRNFGAVHGLSLGGMTIKQLRDEARP